MGEQERRARRHAQQHEAQGEGTRHRQDLGDPVGQRRQRHEAPREGERHEAQVAQPLAELQPQPHVEQVADHEDHQRDLEQGLRDLHGHCR